MNPAKGAFRSTGRVRAAGGWAAGRCYADVTAAGAPARFCAADGLAVGSVAGWAIAVAELEFQCLQRDKRRTRHESQLFINGVSNVRSVLMAGRKRQRLRDFDD